MRYSIMLQIVGIITFTLVSTAALFAWLQNRDIGQPKTLEKEILDSKSYALTEEEEEWEENYVI
ncbi:hypothetical protein STA3757_23120 [Stanieria sp. NIES-3757]|nr:hypothetical protein STA3757_23120 [Stanieria sp. NIES-3757]